MTAIGKTRRKERREERRRGSQTKWRATFVDWQKNSPVKRITFDPINSNHI